MQRMECGSEPPSEVCSVLQCRFLGYFVRDSCDRILLGAHWCTFCTDVVQICTYIEMQYRTDGSERSRHLTVQS